LYRRQLRSAYRVATGKRTIRPRTGCFSFYC
jgi:hypothetical protein